LTCILVVISVCALCYCYHHESFLRLIDTFFSPKVTDVLTEFLHCDIATEQSQ